MAASAAASATAVVSDPPRPSVVTSRSLLTPWKPATITTRPRFSSSRMRSAFTSRIFARVWDASVTMPLCEPVKETASWPRSFTAIETSAIEIRSPAVRSMSISRGCERGET